MLIKRRYLLITLVFSIILQLLTVDVFSTDEPVCEPADYTYTLQDDCVTITKYTGSDDSIRIPTAFEGYPVTAIGIDAFVDCTFTEIILPASLESLEREAFWQCRQLKTVTIPAGIKTICRDAFYNAPLTDIWFLGTIDDWNAISIDGWNGNLTHATIHCSDRIASEGKNVNYSTDAQPYAINISLPTYHVEIPNPDKDAVTIQAAAEVIDQYGLPIIPQTLTWSLYESRSDSGGPHASLNGVSIDENTGIITVTNDAETGSVYIQAYAFSRITSSDGNTRGNGGAGWARLVIQGRNTLPSASGSSVFGNCKYTKTDTGYNATVELHNTADKDQSVRVLLAEYDKDGRLLQIGQESVEIAANGTAFTALDANGKTTDTLTLFVIDDKGVPLTQKCSVKVAGIDAKAWYEVENGNLYIRTNIDCSEWKNGYGGTIRFSFADGDISHQNDGKRSGSIVSFPISILPFWNAGAVVTQVDYLVFDSASMWKEFWNLYEQSSYSDEDFEKTADVLSDHIVARFTLDSPLTVADSKQVLTLASFDITNDDQEDLDIYTASLAEPLSDEGSYLLKYYKESGNVNDQLCLLVRKDDKLTNTLRHHNFADAGSSGHFTVIHAMHKKLDDGSIVCYRAESDPYPYTFVK